MNVQDLSRESAWTPRFDGAEQYAAVPCGAEGALAGYEMTLMVVCDTQPFSQQDRDHARLRCEGLGRNLEPALNHMIRHLSLSGVDEFLSYYGAPTVMLTAGDFVNWSLSFERIKPPDSSVFCDWQNDDIAEVWVAN